MEMQQHYVPLMYLHILTLGVLSEQVLPPDRVIGSDPVCGRNYLRR